MIEQTVQVVAIDGDEAWVESLSQSGCERCDAGQGCGGGVFAKLFGNKQFRIKIDNTLNAVVHEKVVIGIPENAITAGSFLVYLSPIFGMIMGGWFGRYLDVQFFHGQYGELWTIILAIAGAFLAIVFVRFKMKSQSFNRRYAPEMLRQESSVNNFNFS